MAALSKLKPGQIVYNRIRRRAGNTTMRTTVLFPVKIIQIDIENRKVFCVMELERTAMVF